MPKTDPRVDAYIKKSQPFAQPILKHLRKVVHAAVPDVQETVKWSTPHFDYKGPFCGMAAFKQHVGFGFWKADAREANHHRRRMDGRGQTSKLEVHEVRPQSRRGAENTRYRED